MDSMIVLAGSTVGKKLIETLIETHLKPKLQSYYQDNKKIKYVNEKFNEYISRAYSNNSYMKTIVFKNQQKRINDLYIPLTISKSVSKDERGNHEIYMDKYKNEFIPTYKKVLLVDNAGMGKSTLLKFLYLQSIIDNKGIPIFIELRKLGKDVTIIDFIINEINGLKEYFTKEQILNLIEEGDFIFFFDGYDEITNENKKLVTDEIQDFISKTYQNKFIISSRDEIALGCFSDFQRFDIMPLTKEQSYDLIIKYDNNGELSKELINKLETDSNLKIIKEFLKNPLMVSLLYKAFEYKRVIPYKKQIFYRQVYDALYQDHDRIKGAAYEHQKKSNLDIEDFHKLLRVLGIVSLKYGISYYKENLIQMINNAKKEIPGVDFKENDFINDLTLSVPIFIKEGIEYRWAHKSFQEYFAASYICLDSKENQVNYLETISNEQNISIYYNVLDFCYDMDYKEFRNVVIYPFIKEYENYYNNTLKIDKYKYYNRESLDIRKWICFLYDQININIKHMENKEDFHINSFNKEIELVNERRIYYVTKDKFRISMSLIYKDMKTMKILKLLLSKKSNLFVPKKRKRSYLEKENILKLYNKNKNIVIKNVEDDNFNKEIFDIINNLVISSINMSHKRLISYLINYSEVIKLKNAIQEERNNKKELFI